LDSFYGPQHLSKFILPYLSTIQIYCIYIYKSNRDPYIQPREEGRSKFLELKGGGGGGGGVGGGGGGGGGYVLD